MRIKLMFADDTGVTPVQGEDGTLEGIILEPSFRSAVAGAVLANGRAVTEGGKRIESFTMVVSGRTGRTALRRTGVKAIAAIEGGDKAAKGPDKAAKGVDNGG